MERARVFSAISTEREYQEEKWRSPQSTVPEYLIYMQHHMNKAFEALSNEQEVEVCNTTMSQVRKIAALGVACGEQHGMCPRGSDHGMIFTNGQFVRFFGDRGENKLKGFFRCICADETTAVFAKARVEIGSISFDVSDVVIIGNTSAILNDISFEVVDMHVLANMIKLSNSHNVDGRV